DQRIEDVLGPFQKDFEGLVTTESLGGYYGSFLPMYKHPPPITSQTQPLQIVPNFSTRRAPNNHRLEGALLNPVTPVSLIRPVVVSDRKDVVPSQNTLPVNVSAIKNASKNEATTSNVANPSEQNSLRLRIKVGSDKPVRKNYEIYSGLGLLLSPSSSTGNDLEDIGGSTIKSPGCVLRRMIKLTRSTQPGDLMVDPPISSESFPVEEDGDRRSPRPLNNDVKENMHGHGEDESEDALEALRKKTAARD
ncbi:hypothetical protein Tco_0308154, partial [Tanacetum coccineum]